MAKGYSLHIGINHIDPEHYNGENGKLNSCINDAKAMQRIAQLNHYQPVLLLDEQATRGAVRKQILQIANEMSSDDIFLLTYSGHGSRLMDVGITDEEDFHDETWVLFDGQLLDDELWHLWSYFPENARIFALLDACHSATGLRFWTTVESENGNEQTASLPEKALTDVVAKETYKKNKEFYTDIVKTLSEKPKDVTCSIISIAGCQDNQTSRAGFFPWSLSLFTAKLLQVWNNGTFSDNYEEFHKQIVNKMPDINDQHPSIKFLGKMNQNFIKDKPFSI